MGLEELFTDRKISEVLDLLIMNDGFTFSMKELHEQCNVSSLDIRCIVIKLEYYELLEKQDNEGELFYGLSSTDLARKLRNVFDIINVFRCIKEEKLKNDSELK